MPITVSVVRVALAAAACGLSGLAPAQPAAPIERPVAMIIASGPGGGFDQWGRLMARHIGRQLPGSPPVVAQNMPGAGGFVAANHLYTVAARDGSAMAILPAGTLFAPLMGTPGARFDATRFTFVGTPALEIPVCVAFHAPSVKVRSAAQLQTAELVVGSTGPGAGPHTWPKALSGLLGMRFRVVAGFQSTANVLLAIERDEIDGICTIFDTILSQRPDWIRDGKATVLFHAGGAHHPLLKGVPEIGNLAPTADARAAIELLFAGVGFGRPIIAPPDLSEPRAAALQAAFRSTMRDPEFLADAARQKLEIEPRDGPTLAAQIRAIYATPKPIVDRLSELVR